MNNQRQALRQARQALRLKVKAAKAQAEARLAKDPRTMAARRRRRIRRLAGLVLVLLLLLLIRCDCGAVAPTLMPDAGQPSIDSGVLPVDAGPPRRRAATGNTQPVSRPDFATPNAPRPAWLDALRMQVSARSRRLAECLTALERTGALRWTAAVTVETGVVADQSFESVGGTVALNDSQKACLASVLAAPRYTLPAAASSTDDGQRVSLVIEF